MKFRVLLCLLAALPTALSAAEETPPPADHPWYYRLLHPFGAPKEKAPTSRARTPSLDIAGRQASTAAGSADDTVMPIASSRLWAGGASR